jgi:hypothetical protein
MHPHEYEARASEPDKGGRAAPEIHVEPALTTVQGARKILGLGNTSIWSMIGSGELESLKFGRRRMIVVASIHRAIERRLAATKAA